jgi:hypothetical protein
MIASRVRGTRGAVRSGRRQGGSGAAAFDPDLSVGGAEDLDVPPAARLADAFSDLALVI